MKRDEYPDQKLFVLRLQRKGEAVNNWSQDLQELSNTVKMLRLVYKPAKKQLHHIDNCIGTKIVQTSKLVKYINVLNSINYISLSLRQ